MREDSDKGSELDFQNPNLNLDDDDDFQAGRRNTYMPGKGDQGKAIIGVRRDHSDSLAPNTRPKNVHYDDGQSDQVSVYKYNL